MLGYKAKVFRPHTEVSLEDPVPQDNFYLSHQTTDYFPTKGEANTD